MESQQKVAISAERIPDSIKYSFVRVIKNALEDDLSQFKLSTNLATNNGLAFLRGDFINTRLQNDMANDTNDIIHFSRYGWESRLLVDRTNKIAYSVISKNRMQQLIKGDSSDVVPHYTMIFAYALNNQLEAPNKQLSFFGYPFEEKVMEQGFVKLVGGQIQRNSGYNYCVVTYELSGSQLSSCEILIPDKDLDIVNTISLADYMVPEFATLTQQDASKDMAKEDQPRVKLKRKGSSTPSLVALKEEKKNIG
ncbi:MAG: hypothetical protein J1E81_10035 [Eubacterium sp.]|nr:hypothetical protein [Eubacterium sp.]